MVKLLLAHGADPDIANASRPTQKIHQEGLGSGRQGHWFPQF